MVDRNGVLSNSPLVYTLASVRFAPWPLISKKIDEIHDELRKILPLLQHFQIQQQFSVPNQPQTDLGVPVWLLMSGDRSRGVQLSQDQILIISKRYIHYSEFSEVIAKVLKAVFGRMSFMDITSIGIRYVDHIKPLPGETIEQYLKASLLPGSFDGLERLGGMTHAAYKSNDAELRVRCNTQPGTFAVPEDILPILAMMQIPGKPLQVQPLKPMEALLDMDSLEQYDDLRHVEVAEEIIEKFRNLHTVANAFFRREDVCTDHAFKIWKGEIR